jgi:hypothetical protein
VPVALELIVRTVEPAIDTLPIAAPGGPRSLDLVCPPIWFAKPICDAALAPENRPVLIAILDVINVDNALFVAGGRCDPAGKDVPTVCRWFKPSPQMPPSVYLRVATCRNPQHPRHFRHLEELWIASG